MFPLVEKIIENLFSLSSELVLILDRTQWQNTNILMISLAWKKRAIPLYWKILTHKGASNLTKQKAVIRPVIRLLKGQKIIIAADREFHSIFLRTYAGKLRNPVSRRYLCVKNNDLLS